MESREGLDALAHPRSREAKYGFAYAPSVLEAVPNVHADRGEQVLKLYLFSCRTRGTLRCGGFLPREGCP